MRTPVSHTTQRLSPISQEARDDAARHGGDQDAHQRFLQEWPCLGEVECSQAPEPATLGPSLTVAAWNLERCKRVEDSAKRLVQAGADIVLATEMDWGMARSGQRHTTRDLAQLLGMGYVYGVEFVELGTGNAFETSCFEGVPNEQGFHGNAILSRFELLNPRMIPLDEGGLWFDDIQKDGQYRVGGRMAIAAQVAGPQGPITLASAHYESRSDAALRHAQTQRLLGALDAAYGDGPAIIGGDLNTNGFVAEGYSGRDIIAHPERVEPSFTAFRKAGFSWTQTNTGEMTTRAAPGLPVRYPLHILDWVLTRKLAASDPFVRAAVSERGEYLSDHELIGARIAF
ncbi:MAG: endonuclease/exonuclease/phosphatase family protein [Pseudomonadota bacterium]